MPALLLLPGCALLRPNAAPGEGADRSRKPPQPAALRVYLAAAGEQSGYEPAPGGPGLYLAPAAVLMRADLDQARALHSRTRSILQLMLNPIGRERLAQVTRANPGGLLAVYIDDELVATLPISTTVTGGQIQLVGLLSRARAEELAARLNTRGEP